MSVSTILFSFQGRLNRKPYWLASIGLSVVSLLISAVVIGVKLPEESSLVSLITLWPSLAIAVKRCHDRDRTGWFLLVVLIPFVGAIWALIELGFLRGTVGPNRFGQDPLNPPSFFAPFQAGGPNPY